MTQPEPVENNVTRLNAEHYYSGRFMGFLRKRDYDRYRIWLWGLKDIKEYQRKSDELLRLELFDQ